MSGRAPYSRVYWEIVDDPKFAYVYDDDRALACWLRLLMIADQAHPASAHLPHFADKRAVQKLVEVGLVDVQGGGRYRIRGLDAERERRSRRTQEDPSPEPITQPVGDQQVTNRSATGDQSVPRARGRLVSSRLGTSSSSSGGGPGEGLPHLDSAVAQLWEKATGRSVIASGAYAAEYLDDACRRHPPSEVGAAILRARKAFDHIPDAAALISAMRPILDPFVDPKAAAAAERERAAREASRRRTQATLTGIHKNGGHELQASPGCPMCEAVA